MTQKIVKADRQFSRYEWEEIGDKLENFHSIFSMFWQLGKPRFTYDLPTAGVVFDRLGDCIDFNINPDFWDTLNDQQKLFIICHEVTHVLFYHGFRINGLKDMRDMRLANLALDVVVNHFLTDNLGFERSEVDPPVKKEDCTPEELKYSPEGLPNGRLCWIDTVFKDQKKRPLTGEAFEYYFNLIKRQDEEDEKNGKKGTQGMGSVDDHSGLDSFLNKSFEQKMKESLNQTDSKALDEKPEFKKEAKRELDANDKKEKEEGGKSAGIGSGNSWLTAKVVKVLPKRKWETVIKNWASKYYEDKTVDQWQREHRRMAIIPKDLLLPSEYEIEDFEKRRIPVDFFLDTSGSCAHLADRFFTAALTLPEDRFIVNLYCFDTQVYPTDIKSKKLHGFGGTSFTCIDRYINKKAEENKGRYSEAVFVVTDGYGDRVQPIKPNRWYFFLSENYQECLPKDSHIYDLKDFE